MAAGKKNSKRRPLSPEPNGQILLKLSYDVEKALRLVSITKDIEMNKLIEQALLCDPLICEAMNTGKIKRKEPPKKILSAITAYAEYTGQKPDDMIEAAYEAASAKTA